MNTRRRESVPRVVVTGMGLLSPIGCSPDEVLRSILAGASAVRARGETVRGKPVFSGEIPAGVVADDDDPGVDRTGRLAVEAARRALRDAFGDALESTDLQSFGLALGSSHGGRSQLDRLAIEDGDPFELRAAQRFVVASAHHVQTAAVVAALGLGGPTATLSNACSSSGSALEIGVDWVRSGRCPVAVLGGADGYARLTQAGFAALGATSPAPNAPFSLPLGISLGEAAGFVVVETLEHARARGATIHAELFACASTWDAYHLTEPSPDGEGLARAMETALARAGWDASRIGFVHAHGTGTRLNDVAECRALARSFGDRVPPVCSSKSMTGHVLGASAVVGLIAGIVGMNNGLIPPTANYSGPRPGCSFDFVPNVPREASYSAFAVQVAGFGGANAVVLAGRPESTDADGPDAPTLGEVVITGAGTVEPAGLEGEAGRAAVRKRAAALGLRRADDVVEFAAAAAADALRQAGLQPLADGNGERIGLVVGTTRGEAARFEAYLESARGGAWDKASALHFPHLVMSALGGQVSRVLGLKGAAFTVVDGAGAGLSALCHAAETLLNHDDLDAIVVVAADETTPRLSGCLERLGRPVPGAGAASVVLERAAVSAGRGVQPLARIMGLGLASGSPDEGIVRAISAALADEGVGESTVDDVVGCGRARAAMVPESLRSKFRAWEARGVDAPEAACGLLAVVDALGSLRGCTLVAGATDEGNGAAVVLGRARAESDG